VHRSTARGVASPCFDFIRTAIRTANDLRPRGRGINFLSMFHVPTFRASIQFKSQDLQSLRARQSEQRSYIPRLSLSLGPRSSRSQSIAINFDMPYAQSLVHIPSSRKVMIMPRSRNQGTSWSFSRDGYGWDGMLLHIVVCL
jgi:hypothetical protein